MCLPVVAVLWSVDTQEAFELPEGAHVCVCFVLSCWIQQSSFFVLESSSLASTRAVDLQAHMDAELARLKLQLDAAVKKNIMLGLTAASLSTD